MGKAPNCPSQNTSSALELSEDEDVVLLIGISVLGELLTRSSSVLLADSHVKGSAALHTGELGAASSPTMALNFRDMSSFRRKKRFTSGVMDSGGGREGGTPFISRALGSNPATERMRYPERPLPRRTRRMAGYNDSFNKLNIQAFHGFLPVYSVIRCHLLFVPSNDKLMQDIKRHLVNI